MIKLKINEKIIISYWFIPLSIIFLFGGMIQYIGILSFTQTNFLVLLLLFPIFLYKYYWRSVQKEVFLFLLLGILMISSYLNDSSISSFFTYFYYIFCTIIAAYAGRTLCKVTINNNGVSQFEIKYIFYVKILLFTQLIFCLIQNVFGSIILRYSAIEIPLEDVVSGTMYLKSDASLAACSQLVMISIFLIRSKFLDKLCVILLVLGIIFLGNSKASQAIVVLVLSGVLFYYIHINSIMKNIGFQYLYYVFFIFIIFFWFLFFSESVIKEFIDHTMYLYQKRDSWIMAERLAPVGQIFYEDIKYFGDGPLTYYNPIEKKWLYNAGFSTIYSLYIDLGLLGIILYSIYYIKLIGSYTKNLILTSIFLIVWIAFSQFNLTLSDIAFAFLLNFILVMLYYVNLDKKNLKSYGN